MNNLRTSEPQKRRKLKNNDPQTKFTGSYKKKIVFILKIINRKFYYGHSHKK